MHRSQCGFGWFYNIKKRTKKSHIKTKHVQQRGTTCMHTKTWLAYVCHKMRHVNAQVRNQCVTKSAYYETKCAYYETSVSQGVQVRNQCIQSVYIMKQSV